MDGIVIGYVSPLGVFNARLLVALRILFERLLQRQVAGAFWLPWRISKKTNAPMD
jgi:hypothetical protein